MTILISQYNKELQHPGLYLKSTLESIGVLLCEPASLLQATPRITVTKARSDLTTDLKTTDMILPKPRQ